MKSTRLLAATALALAAAPLLAATPSGFSPQRLTSPSVRRSTSRLLNVAIRKLTSGAPGAVPMKGLSDGFDHLPENRSVAAGFALAGG